MKDFKVTKGENKYINTGARFHIINAMATKLISQERKIAFVRTIDDFV